MSRRQLDRAANPLGSGPGASDDTGCPILHVDMDAFFASVEERENPALRGKPVIVGGAGPRGVVSSASYAARAFGVHSAMPMSRARRLCPHAVIVSPGHGRYSKVSAAVMEILRSVTPEVEPLSLDEAFLDVSGALRRLGRPAEIAAEIRRRVSDEQQLTCSVGVAPSKFTAKLASTHAKPDGLLVVPAARVTDFLHPLPVGALWGVGDRAEESLRRLGLRTIGDVAHYPRDTLVRELGEALGTRLAELAWGRDAREVTAATPDRSIGAEHTFDTDVRDPDAIRRTLLRLAEKTAARLRAADRLGRTITVKLRRGDFSTITRSRTLPEHTDTARDIHTTACALYEGAGLWGTPLRLVGVRVENLASGQATSHQLALDEPDAGWREAERAMDRAARRFGPGTIRPAALFDRESEEEGG
ncbi:DNA polymerase IV [Allonocardiopsis opalescens]|uniref:DNA polymerase IV n=1 Tax=Allonocardiopsis opalescens TaxID=1144618 RepID=A0A2T0Q3Z6_9ACTN|nr:DNA polymerase IV [Allonocardiopsis opalescens]PRX98473.1 DNA polymerase-4 [Allonocardiopsis opalescens]